MPTITLDKIIFRNNDTYIKMYQGSELIAQVDSGGGYDYLTFTALTAGSTVNFNRPDITTCSYSVDNGTTWTNGDNVTVTLTNIGDKVMYKGVTSAAGTSSDSTVVFTMTGGIKASGSLMSMHNGNPNDTSITYNYEFAAFFNNCSALTDITDLKLPATTLTLSCYNRLFKNTGITSVPSGFLPATTIVESSYSRMFYNCTSLTTVPSNLLPATNFQDTNCYNNMFYGCSALTAAPNLPATTLVRGCYSYMFRNCTRLTSIPDLPAKEIIYQCYYYMFAGCTGLTGTVKVPFDSINSSYNNACSYMFSGCSLITGAEVGTNAGYTSVSVFSNMFRNCSILSSIKCLANYSSNISYSNWVTGVASSGTFIKATGQGWNTGNSGIPTSWTVTEQSPVVPVPEVKGYVTLTNNGNTNSSISVSSYSSVSDGRLVYSTDGTTWNWLTNTAVTLASGSSMYLAGDKISSGSNNNLSITNGSVSISGNVRYLYECSSETPGTMPGSALTYRFKNCTGLVDASGLIMPSTTSYSCYSYMFSGCKSLTSVPSLPATTLTGNCYYGMFQGCTSLTTAPSLPATTLTSNCYYNMFYGCSALTTAPELPATTLAGTCYYGMFSGCTSLTTAPTLPATTLASSCYSYMFDGCTSLTTAPTLPATTLANYCYYEMFNGCTSLTTAPEIYAEHSSSSSATQPMSNMFNGCSSLNSITTHTTTWDTNLTPDWVLGVAATGDFYSLGGAIIPTGTNGSPSGWSVHTPTPTPVGYITLTNNGDTNTSIRVNNYSNTQYGRLVYSTDGTTWNWLTNTEVTVLPNRSLYISGDKACSDTSSVPYNKLSITGGSVSLSGNVRYLYEGTSSTPGTMPAYALTNRFYGCTGITDISDLVFPNVTSNYCYYNMFYSSRVNSLPPNLLPATTLSQGCYAAMFQGCIISSIPTGFLPATNLANYCYNNMFANNQLLTTVPTNLLPATTLTGNCYHGMFYGCKRLTNLPNLPATNLANHCYNNMFGGCTSLTSIPSNYLPATTLRYYCYQNMFYNCTSLTTVPSNLLPATTVTDSCYNGMFSGCTSLTTAPDLPNSTALRCYEAMFYGCTSLTSTPVLYGASTMSHVRMFQNCSNLNTVTIYANIWGTTNTTNWLDGVAATGDFYSLGNIGTNIPSGADGVPSGWTIHTELPPTPSTPVPTSVSIFNQYNDGTTPSTNYGTLTENTNDYTYTYSGSSYSDRWTGVDIMLPYDCSSFTYHIVASIPGGATSGVNVVAPNANGNATNQMSSGSTSFDSDITVTRPSSATQGNDWRLRTYLKRDGSQSDLTPITITIPKSTI